MLELEDALQRILDALPPPRAQTLPLARADGRVLLEPAIARVDLPGFDNSAVDGYAVRAADVAGARPDSPVRLRLVARIAAGQPAAIRLEPGQCARVFTGSCLPSGADAVLMQETVTTDPSDAQWIVIRQPVQPSEHLRRRAEDVARGAMLVGAGERLTPLKLALLAAAGIAEVRVGTPPRVVLLATGSELYEPGAVSELPPGGIYESNRIALAALTARAGGLPVLLPPVADVPEAIAEGLQRALEAGDLVVSSGGVSVGEFDHVKSVFTRLGGRVAFWRVAMKPGRPFVFGWREGKFFFGLPGNPVSALVTFLLLVRPALLRWQGARDVSPPTQWGELAQRLDNPDERRHFVRVRVDDTGRVWSAGRQASHLLGSLAAADGLVDVAPRSALPEGSRVKVLRWD